MTVESLAPVRARATERLLEQHLIRCPGCEKPAAVHLHGADLATDAQPVVVRVICPDGCVVHEADVLHRLSPAALTADASMTA